MTILLQTFQRFAWVPPWLVLLLVYGALGWLDPDAWLGSEKSHQLSILPPAKTVSSAANAFNPRKSSTPPNSPPWPDESALRQQLAWRSLRPLGFTQKAQRSGSREVRMIFRFQGRMGDGLDMLQWLALEWPQMLLENLIIQNQSVGQWHFEWRGQWRQVNVPSPVPSPDSPLSDLRALGALPVFDFGWLRRHQQSLWSGASDSQQVLRMVQPEQLLLVAQARDPAPIAWVTWQQHVLMLRLGNRVGPESAVVRSISPDEVVVGDGERRHRIRPARFNIAPIEFNP